MYSLPSASQMRAPSPLAATTGSPPTPRKARTGEFTPPGNNDLDLRRISADRSPAIAADAGHWKRASRHGRCRHGSADNSFHERRAEVVVIHNFFDRDIG